MNCSPRAFGNYRINRFNVAANAIDTHARRCSISWMNNRSKARKHER